MYESTSTPKGDAQETYTFDTLLAARSFVKKATDVKKTMFPKSVIRFTELL